MTALPDFVIDHGVLETDSGQNEHFVRLPFTVGAVIVTSIGGSVHLCYFYATLGQDALR